VGHHGTILKTTNGGTNWTSQTSGSGSQLNGVFFLDANNGYVAGGDDYGGSGTILKTTNGGTNWTSQFNDPNAIVWSVQFTDANIGHAVGGPNTNIGSTIYRTTNGGANWTTQSGGTSGNLVAVHFPSAAIGYAVGSSGVMLRTTNAGAAWTPLSSGTGNDLASVYFTSTNVGYTVGLGGTILKTTNGATAIDYLTADKPLNFSLAQNYPNPFNPATTIKFVIPVGTRHGVSLQVFDLLGRRIATLMNETKDAGEYSARFDASSLPSGVYFYRLTSGLFTQTKRMLLLK
jgi:photosystem II stability/assembly factor-like uncharacterized protein